MQERKEQTKRQESLGLLTVNHVAKILNVHNRTVFRLIWSDTLKASKVGRQWRIHRDWVDEYLERQSENRSTDERQG
ncbi:MAG: helix-turn-helix domain-containing protein [Candidatus Marinimicrobia bacterium]|nr:helix-turn-helix domain-containing protein [Candidatus Neomarinimicrobiota bacterium]